MRILPNLINKRLFHSTNHKLTLPISINGLRNNTRADRPVSQINTVILDNSGTCVDPFVIAPAKAFRKAFKKYNLDITMEQARGPMGIRKYEHIKTLLEMPQVKRQFQEKYNRSSKPDDIVKIYELFVPIQMEILPDHCRLLPYVSETMAMLRNKGIKFGTTTGFNREMVDCILENTDRNELSFESTMAGDDFNVHELHLGTRPRPFMIWKNLFKLDAWPIRSVVKVDDTNTGIEEGLNAGCWTVAISDYGNYMNIDSYGHWLKMDEDERQQRREHSRTKMMESGAHYVIHEFKDLLSVVEDINMRLEMGENP